MNFNNGNETTVSKVYGRTIGTYNVDINEIGQKKLVVGLTFRNQPTNVFINFDHCWIC